MSVTRIATTAAVALAVAAATAGAQAKCEIEDGKPGQLKDARDALVKASVIGSTENKTKELSKAIKLVTQNPEKLGNNTVGRNWVLARALVTYATLPDMSPVVPRATVVYSSNRAELVDLVLSSDSAFDAFEAAAPACAAEIEQYRRLAYVPLVNSAVQLYNARQIDSAAALAQRAATVYPNASVAHNVLGNIAQQRDSFVVAANHFREMVKALGTDSTAAEERQTTWLNVPTLLLAEAERAPEAQKADLVKQAVAEYQAYLAEFPEDARGKASLARAQMASGDSASAVATFTGMLSEVDKYSAMQLFEAGVGAARAERNKEAAQLFEAGLKKNPYYRDALYNLAATLHASDQLDAMLPVAQRLIEVDPNNPDNYQLLALHYQSKARATTAAAARKVVNDSLLKYFKLYSEAPVKVSFDGFSHDEAKHKLSGRIENRGTAAKSYTLSVQFLDATGNVVTSKDVTVDAVPPKESKAFSVEAEGEGIVAFKYAPISG